MKYINIFVIVLIYLTIFTYCNDITPPPVHVETHSTETHPPVVETHPPEIHVDTHPPVVETHPPETQHPHVTETHPPTTQPPHTEIHTDPPKIEIHTDHIGQNNQEHQEVTHEEVHHSAHLTDARSQEAPGEQHTQPDGTFMTISVNQREEDCLYEFIPGDHLFTLDFEVVKGGLLDIEFKIKNEQEQVLYSKLGLFSSNDDVKNEAASHVEFRTHHSSTYGLCFDNTNSRWTAKTVSIFIPTIKGSDTQLGSPDVHHDMATSDHLTPFIESVIKIGEELDSIERVQHHMRVREAVHRDTAEDTNARVMWLAIIESAILITISIFQLAYIRNWFADTDRRRRV